MNNNYIFDTVNSKNIGGVPTRKADLTKLVLILLFLMSFIIPQNFHSQALLEVTTPNPANGTTGVRAPSGTASAKFLRAHLILLASDLTAIPVGTDIKTISFSASTPASTAASGNIKFYMQLSTDVTNLKGTNYATAVAGMTQVYDGTINLPQGTQTKTTVTLNTPFKYTGGSLYIAYEYTGATFSTTGTVYNANTNLANGAYSASSATALPTTLSATSFRPQVILGFDNRYQNDLSVTNIDALGYYARPVNDVNSAAVTVKNSGSQVQNNIVVNLNVTGANPEMLSQTIPTLAAGASTTVNFTLTTNVDGAQVITATVPNDEVNTNNSFAYNQNVQCCYNRYIGTQTTGGGLGFNTGTGIAAVRYTSGSKAIYVNSIKMRISNDAASVGNTISGKVLDAAGAIIASSADYVIQSGDLNNEIEMMLTAPVKIEANSVFYTGYLQTANTSTGYFPLAYVILNPTKPNTYFTTSPTGGTMTNNATLNDWVIGYTASDATQAVNNAAVSQMAVYPNPTNGILNVKTVKSEAANIFDAAGKLVKQVQLQKGTDQIDMTRLAPGLYILKTSDKEIKVLKK